MNEFAATPLWRGLYARRPKFVALRAHGRIREAPGSSDGGKTTDFTARLAGSEKTSRPCD
jgi:hypothetical protein